MGRIYIAFSTSPAWLSRLIRWATGSSISHTLLIFKDEDLDEWVSLGADPEGWTYKSLKYWLEGGSSLTAAFDLDGYDLHVGLRKNADKIGSPYDKMGFVGMGPVMLALRLLGVKIKNPLGSNQKWFCSEINTKIIEDSGINLGLEPGSTTPQALADAVIALKCSKPVDVVAIQREALGSSGR